MDNNEIDEIAMQRIIKTESRKWKEFERIILRPGGEAHCFYCNFNQECGQQECIWREDCA